MKVYASEPLPSNEELVQILNKRFSGIYSSRLFGLGNDKTIMVRHTSVASAQISVRDNEITVQGVPLARMAILSGTEAGLVYFFFAFIGWLTGSYYKDVEKNVAVFLHEKYGKAITTP